MNLAGQLPAFFRQQFQGKSSDFGLTLNGFQPILPWLMWDSREYQIEE
jgi:hypothetical protein